MRKLMHLIADLWRTSNSCGGSCRQGRALCVCKKPFLLTWTTTMTIDQHPVKFDPDRLVPVSREELTEFQRVAAGQKMTTTQNEEGQFLNEATARAFGMWRLAVCWTVERMKTQAGRPLTNDRIYEIFTEEDPANHSISFDYAVAVCRAIEKELAVPGCAQRVDKTEENVAAPASPVAQQDERAMFEAWFDSVPESERMRTLLAGNRMVSLAAWEARAALSAAPERQDAQGQKDGLEGRLIEMQQIIREGSRWNGNEQEFADKTESDVAMLDDLLSDALRLAAPSVPTGGSINDGKLETLLGDLAYARDRLPGGVRDAKESIRAHVASKVQAARDEASQWISVDERLPEDCALVLIHCPNMENPEPENGIWAARWMAGSQTFESRVHGWLAKDEVTHWVPIPRSPAATDAGEQQ